MKRKIRANVRKRKSRSKGRDSYTKLSAKKSLSASLKRSYTQDLPLKKTEVSNTKKLR